ncbi:MAG: phosphoglycerate dehydrogenase [Candidatus Caenarcaniphilales bacterium]|nr:phosphoglycerate dehydrogenase [Candidatus Caenarcaniphilales bacterium]
MAAKVLVTDKLDSSGLNILESSCELDYKPGTSPEELKSCINNYDALLIRSQTQVTKEVLEQASNLKIIGRAGVGVDNIDIGSATEKGVIVVNSPEGNTISAAEHTVALMMAMMRKIPEADASTKVKKWERSKFVGAELNSRTLGIVGLGKIGQRVGKVALALGMKVIGFDPYVSKEKADDLGFTKVELAEIFTQADLVTLHVPKTPETENMVNAETIKTMKDGAYIINCARGGLVNEQDLADALNSGKLAGAAIDVFVEEPLKESPLQACGDKVVLTPHLGASTKEAQVNVALDVAEQIRDVLSGGVARSAVNLPGLKPELLKAIKHYLPLAEHMGAVLAQLSTGCIKYIEIEALGKLADKNIEGLKLAILKGILSQNIDGVSFVNAPMIAKERGIKLAEMKSDDSGAYVDKLKIVMKTESGEKTISGTVLQENIPTIIEIDSFPVNIQPDSHSVVTFHRDEPGKVAQISKILWDAGINISSLNLGRKDDTASAVMVINVDSEIDSSILKSVSAIEGIDTARYVRLKGI